MQPADSLRQDGYVATPSPHESFHEQHEGAAALYLRGSRLDGVHGSARQGEVEGAATGPRGGRASCWILKVSVMGEGEHPLSYDFHGSLVIRHGSVV